MSDETEQIEITGDAVVEVARSLIGVPFLHQGRDTKGLDCVGLCVYIANHFNVEVEDLVGYNRTPSATKLREMVEKNLIPIPMDEVEKGDFLLMRLGGLKPRHVAVVSNIETDYVNGIEPTIIHAYASPTINRVTEQKLSQFKNDVVAAFRIPNKV